MTIALAVSAPASASSPWLAEGSCETLFDRLPDSLPGGARLESFAEGAHLYRLPDGGTLRIEGPEIRRAELSGMTFAEAHSNLFEAAPFGLRGRHGPGRGVVLAQVDSQYDGEVTITGSHLGYAADQGSAELKITPVVHLADWSGYAAASAGDQRLWDKALCSQAHHELGHILVAAQVMTEFETALTRIANPTQSGISLAVRSSLERMMSDIKRAQGLYHAEIANMGTEMADSRPYLDLPFSWLGGEPDSSATTDRN